MKIPKLLLVTFAALTLTMASATADTPPPVATGEFCTLWYDAPALNMLAGLKERRAFVRIQEVRGDWVKVEQYPSEDIATMMSSVGEVEKGTAVGLKLLESLSMTKEQFLQKADEDPLPADQRRTIWLNLAAVEAISPIKLDLQMLSKEATQDGDDPVK